MPEAAAFDVLAIPKLTSVVGSTGHVEYLRGVVRTHDRLEDCTLEANFARTDDLPHMPLMPIDRPGGTFWLR